MRQTIIQKKDKLIDILIDDLQANEYESREYIYDLVREALRNRTLTDLKELVSNNQPEYTP
jgi:polyhydroxyalkanoate synthesis regulator phasin